MPIRGTLKTSDLRIAQMQFDFLRQPMHVHVLAALVDPTMGTTRAWVPATGVVWSKETAAALAKLTACMEHDIAASMMVTSDADTGTQGEGKSVPTGGIGELVSGSTAPDAPSM